MTMKKSSGEEPVTFRRFRTLPSGTVLDAHDFGLKAWPMRLGRALKQKP
jgi:hypothetical protein